MCEARCARTGKIQRRMKESGPQGETRWNCIVSESLASGDCMFTGFLVDTFFCVMALKIRREEKALNR